MDRGLTISSIEMYCGHRIVKYSDVLDEQTELTSISPRRLAKVTERLRRQGGLGLDVNIVFPFGYKWSKWSFGAVGLGSFVLFHFHECLLLQAINLEACLTLKKVSVSLSYHGS